MTIYAPWEVVEKLTEGKAIAPWSPDLRAAMTGKRAPPRKPKTKTPGWETTRANCS